jgi:hypothetical protein
MAKATSSISSSKRDAERLREHRCAVIYLARYRAKKAVEAHIRAQGKRPTIYSPGQLRALGQAELELNRISLIAEAEKAIATWPGFAYLRCADESGPTTMVKTGDRGWA